ncbi:cytochrome P450 [Mycena polygramma]|nr:cytochrome P450 [Mycena polygramma]
MTTDSVIAIAGTLVFYAVYHLSKILYQELTSPLRDLPGPKGVHLILGHLKEMQSDFAITTKWREEFGANYQFRGLFNTRHLYTTDIKALNHIILNDQIYQRGPVANKLAASALGNGLLSVETAEHKRQRKILNPAFGVPQIRELTEVFNQKSAQLRDIWSRQIGHDSESCRIDVFVGLRKMTLDVIGEAGFNYQFNAMHPEVRTNDLDDALTRLMHSPRAQRQDMMRLLQVKIPMLAIFPTPGAKVVNEARTKMVGIAKTLLADSQANIKAGEKASTTKRDLLSLMVQSNMSPDIREDTKLSDSDVVAQIPTFFVAGHETTSTATALALHALSLNPSVQSKLREELLTLASDDPTMDELNSLAYLENVVRETMRVFPPVQFTQREAMVDDVLPLSKAYLDRHGKLYDSITIRKGTAIRIPIAAVHRDKEIWGEDADEFRPERWDEMPYAASAIPSVWGNLMTFLAGSHNCIGFRFSVVEIKSLLFTLLRAFEFEAAIPEGGIGFSATTVMHPKVLSEPEGGSQLPLIVRPYSMS